MLSVQASALACCASRLWLCGGYEILFILHSSDSSLTCLVAALLRCLRVPMCAYLACAEALGLAFVGVQRGLSPLAARLPAKRKGHSVSLWSLFRGHHGCPQSRQAQFDRPQALARSTPRTWLLRGRQRNETKRCRPPEAGTELAFGVQQGSAGLRL